MQQWAAKTVADMVSSETEELASKDGGLRVPDQTAWDFIQDFSLERIAKIAQDKSPTLLRVLTAAASGDTDQWRPAPMAHTSDTQGRGCNRRNASIVCLLLYSPGLYH